MIITMPFKIDSPYEYDRTLSVAIRDGEIISFSGLADFCGATYEDIDRAVKFFEVVGDTLKKDK